MGDSKFGALVLFAIVGFLVAAGGAALADGAQPTTYYNESVTVDYGNETNVSETGVGYHDEVTVYNSAEEELTSGEDYGWNATAGNLTWFDTAATTDGEEAAVTYTVDQLTEASERYARIVDTLKIPLALLAALLLGIAAIKGVNP